jgi:hypothetical protein
MFGDYYQCECYKIGGPFIAEDPNCPKHGTEAQRDAEELEQALSITFEEYRASLEEGEYYDLMEAYKAGDYLAFAAAAFEAGKRIGR